MSLVLLLDRTATPPDPRPAAPIRVRERPPLRTHITGAAPNGREFRWGKDDPDPTNVAAGVQYGDTMPGGFDRLGLTLPRSPGVDYADLQRGSTLCVRDAGGGIVGEYRLERAPRTSGEQMAVSPDAAGWQTHLEDDKTAAAVFRDCTTSRWTGPSASRRLALKNLNIPHQNDPSANWDTDIAGPALTLELQGAWASPNRPMIEAWYDAGAGSRIGRIAASWRGVADAAFVLFPAVTDSQSVGTYSSPGDVYGAASGSFDFQPSVRFRYGLIQWQYATTPAGADGASFPVALTGLSVYGDHGLTVYGSGIDSGLLASDMVAYAISRWAPKLKYSTGADGSIQASSLPIPQAAFHDPTTVLAILQEVSKYELPQWAVWENQTFYYHQPGYRGRRWRARVAPAGLQETGPQIDRLWNGVLVAYQDADGSTRTVGPPGSGADTETSTLLDTDPANPVNQLGIRRWDMLSMGIASTPAAATRVGQQFLIESRLLDTSGQARIVGYVEDDRGVLWPYHAVRSGDTIEFVDAADPSPRRIVKTDKDDSARAVTLSLDAPPEGLDALLARLGVALVPLGL